MTTDRVDGLNDDFYYDPFDREIDKNPYPIWKRLRDEAPWWYNERKDFYTLSRFADVEEVMRDWDTYRSGHGSTLDIIKANIELPPGIILMEDPPEHDVHRGLLSRVFTPRKMNALEPKIREFCARTLDPLRDAGSFDFVADLGAEMPMRTIGMLLGIPEADQVEIRDSLDEAMTYIMLLAGAGNETATRLIGWTGKLLAEHPDQRREIANDRSLIPNAIEEVLRFEAPSPVQARVNYREVTWHGVTIPERSAVVILNGSANRDEREFVDGETFNIHCDISRHLSFRYGIHFCLGAALARLEGRVALDEVLNRWPEWDVDWDNAKQAHTPHVRGWERLPVVTG